MRPPKGSPSNYEYAHQGETLTDDGDVVRTAVIGGGAGHAPIDSDSATVPAFYDNSGTQLMRVRYGEDDNGLWFAGALWPDVDDLDIAKIRASSLSGDWRWHSAWRETGAGYDFAGACLVNIPGYPMPTSGNGIGDRAGRMRRIAASIGDCIVGDGDVFVASEFNASQKVTEGGDEVDEAKLSEEQISAIAAVVADRIIASSGASGDEASGGCGGDCTCDKDEEAPEASAEDIIASLSERVDALSKRLEPVEADVLARQVMED